jgi:UDP-N-acetyl-D-mannosaminuronic acid dehydrogenase
VAAVNNGVVPFVEPDLGIHVAGAVSQGRLRAQFETPSADAYIVAVPTPFKADKSADMSYIGAAARAIAPQLRGGELVILESTSPPGSTRRLADLILGLRPDLSLDGQDGKSLLLVAHCPERVLPGRIMIELVTNDRVVGGLTSEAADAAAALYGVFCQGEIHLTDAATAEMSKLVENAYRDVNIAFANELSMAADAMGLDVWEVIRLANRHPRVNILNPGPGVGGHCIAVDPWFIVHGAPEQTPLIRTARGVNDSKIHHTIARAAALVEAHPGMPVACLGLAFKANIDDFRESPARLVAATLARRYGERVRVVEPYASELPIEFTGTGAELVDIDTALETCGVLIVLVDHDLFRSVPLAEREGKVVYDARGIWPDQPAADPIELRRAG